MTYDMARPRYTLPFAGTDYELVGTFELIEAVEFAMKEGIIQVSLKIMDLSVTETARLVATLVSATGRKMSAGEAGTIIAERMGLFTEDFLALKLHLHSFFKILFAPPKDREEVARREGEAIGEWRSAHSASPGNTTSSPA